MTIQLFRPAELDPDGDNRYAVVIDDGDGGIEFYDHAGTMHDVPILNGEHTGCESWIELEAPAETLTRVARCTELAGKERSTAWLLECAQRSGRDEAWPPAPAYKGAVVHLNDPRPDFAALSDAQLRDLRVQIVTEMHQRRGLPEPVDAPEQREAAGQ